MASPSTGTSSSSSMMQSSGSDENLQAAMDQRKRKRKESNRESARRSRMRKQQHLDELMEQVNQLREENGRVMTALSAITRQRLAVEAENSVLRTQMMELSSRLQSLDEILLYLNGHNNNVSYKYAMAAGAGAGVLPFDGPQIGDAFANPWNFAHVNHHHLPIMASADMNMFQY